MNKLFKHLTASLLGLAMAVGVGVSVANVGNKAAKVEAASTANVDISERADTFNWENGKAYSGWKDSSGHFTFSQIGGGNNGKYYTSGENWRFYSGGGLKIEADTGYKILSVSSTPACTFNVADGGGSATASFTATTKFTAFSISYSDGSASVTINKINDAYALYKGSTGYQLTYSYDGTTVVNSATWSTSNSSVIAISDANQGLVNVVGNRGETADITVKLFDASSAEICSNTQTFTVYENEPEVVAKTVTEANALCSGDVNSQTKSYNVTGVVSSIDSTKYGNLKITDGETVLVVYGCTATSTALIWNGLNYKFTNPQDYADKLVTKSIKVGDTITIKAICYVYVNTKTSESTNEISGVFSDEVSSIAVAELPTKSTYGVGEEFNAAGLTLDVTFKSGPIAEDVSSGYTVDPATYTFAQKDALAGKKQFTVSYGGKSTTFEVSVVAAREVVSIDIKEYPTKDSYRVGQTFDSTGLVITAHYDDESSSDYSSGYTTDCDGYVFTEDDLEAGTKTVTVTFEGKTDEFDVSITDFLGFDSGRYFILNSAGTKALTGAVASSVSPVQTTIGEAVAFDFEKVEDYTYEISITVEETTSYLVCNTTAETSDNNKIRVLSSSIASKSVKWTLEEQTDEGHEGTYLMKTNTTGSIFRYLSAYNSSSDWRGYIKNPDTGAIYGDPYIKIVEEKEMFRSNFLNVFTASCDAQGATNLTTLAADWAKAEAQFESLSAANQALVAGTEDDVTERYDYIVGRYNAEHAEITNFMERSVTPLSLGGHFMNAETENTSIFVIVISVVSGISLAGVFFIRRRKEN